MSKYRNKKAVVDGIVFASLKEARRYNDLKLLQAAGEIRNLECQPKFLFFCNGEYLTHDNGRRVTYIADFLYTKRGENKPTVEDVKGFKTPVYKLKKAMMKTINGIEVLET